ISSILVKPASAICNLDCEYCFYLDRDTDPYTALAERTMSLETLERLVEGFLSYSYPQSSFGFQGGEPTLAGLKFFESLVALQKRHGKSGQTVGNTIQTNGILLDRSWCELFRDYNFLVGLPLAEFHPDGTPMPFTIDAEEYGRFLCRIFDLWWPERHLVRIRFFDNIAEALAGQKPGTCTMHERDRK